MMNFYDTKNDIMRSDITLFWEDYCNHHSCTNCAFSAVTPGHRIELCKQWAQNFPVEAANLMRLQPVYDHCNQNDCLLYDNDCPWDMTFTPYNPADKDCQCYYRCGSANIAKAQITPYKTDSKDEPDDWEAELDKILAEDYGKLLEEFSK